MKRICTNKKGEGNKVIKFYVLWQFHGLPSTSDVLQALPEVRFEDMKTKEGTWLEDKGLSC